MKKHTLTLALAAVLATSPALAADWAHNDPDKASVGKVDIWDGSKNVTVNSIPSTAVATLGGGVTALGGVVQSPLSFNQFIAANDLDAANWKDVTFKPGLYSVSISGTELAKKSVISSINTFSSKKNYSGEGVFSLPPNSAYSISNGKRNIYGKTTCPNYGACAETSKCYVTGLVSKSPSSVTIGYLMTTDRFGRQVNVTCPGGYGFDVEPRLTITSPPADGVNYFIKVNE